MVLLAWPVAASDGWLRLYLQDCVNQWENGAPSAGNDSKIQHGETCPAHPHFFPSSGAGRGT